MVQVCPKDASPNDQCHVEEDDAWLNLAKGLSPLDKKKEVKITHLPFGADEGIDDPDLARINYFFDDTDHITYMRRENGAWRVALNEGIDPSKAELPDAIPKELRNKLMATQSGAIQFLDKKKKAGQGKLEKFLDKIMFWKSDKVKIGR